MSEELRVLSAGFAPVKGTRHLDYAAVQLDADGPVGDRVYCLVDVERHQVLRTVQHPALMAVVARVEDGALTVSLPSGGSATVVPVPTGETVACDYWGRAVRLALLDGPHSELFSTHLGRPVRLTAAPRGGVVFADPVTIVTSASIRDLAERAGHPTLPAEHSRFRATLVVDTDEPYAEEQWLGREVRAGGVLLRIGGGVPRCAVIDHGPITGVKDVRLLKTLASYRPLNTAGEPIFGVYARVLQPGTILR